MRSPGRPWRRGVALVDEHGGAISPTTLALGSFAHRLPRGRVDSATSPRPSSSSACRVDELRLAAAATGLGARRAPRVLEDLHPRGLRDRALPLPAARRPRRPRPALVCPCHYSTFDPRAGARGRSSGPPAARCRSCRSDRPAASSRPPAALRAASARPGGACASSSEPRGARRASWRSSARAPRAPSCARRCATSSPTTGRSCSARSRCTRSSCSSPPASSSRSSSSRASATTTYHGAYAPLRGHARCRAAYARRVDLSFDVPAGLLIRQTHHWAALVFVVAIVAAPAARLLHRRVPQAARAQLVVGAARC